MNNLEYIVLLKNFSEINKKLRKKKKLYKHIFNKLFNILDKEKISSETKLLLLFFIFYPQQFIICGYDKKREEIKLAHIHLKKIINVPKSCWYKLLIEKQNL